MKTRTTDTILADMIEFAREGNNIIPMFFQPARGIDNKVSAAVRKGLKTGAIVKGGLDGVGKAFYVLPAPIVPAATHIGSAAIN